MKCTYLNWLIRKDNAVQNAQYSIERGDKVMEDYWKNQADFCDRIINKLINLTAGEWLAREYGSVD